MAHHGQKVAFGLIGVLSRQFRLQQLDFALLLRADVLNGARDFILGAAQNPAMPGSLQLNIAPALLIAETHRFRAESGG